MSTRLNDSRRFLALPELLNARDLGGYPTRGGGRTLWRSLLRSDDLVQLTPAGLESLTQFGVRTVIDLRWPEEAAVRPTPCREHLSHIEYIHISLLARSEAEWLAAEIGCTKETWNCLVLQRSQRELSSVLRAIAHASPGPLLFHCVAGKDRTGVVAALLLAIADAEPEAIAYDYAASTERLRDAYLARFPEVSREEILEAVRCPEEGAYNMLDYLAALGGVREYLMQIGLTAHEISRLRARLRDSA